MSCCSIEISKNRYISCFPSSAFFLPVFPKLGLSSVAKALEDKIWVCFHFGCIIVYFHNALSIQGIGSYWLFCRLALFGFVWVRFGFVFWENRGFWAKIGGIWVRFA